MGFRVENGLGDSIDAPSPEQMRELLFAVDASDLEHGAAWLATDDEYVLEWNGDGRLVFDVGGHLPERHMKDVSRERALALWQLLAEGRAGELEREQWHDGSGNVLTPERQADIVAWQAKQDRAFYDLLGPERPGRPCKRPSCSHGAITQSVLCRAHHFEMIQGRPCPFDD
jgi:hypothetical protein